MLFTLKLTQSDGNRIVAKGFSFKEAEKLLFLYKGQPEVRFASNSLRNNLYRDFGDQFGDAFHYHSAKEGFTLELSLQNATFATIVDHETNKCITVIEDTPELAAAAMLQRITHPEADAINIELKSSDFAILLGKISEVLFELDSGSDEAERDVINEGVSDMNLSVVFKGY